MRSEPERSTLDLLVSETVSALIAPVRFARSLRDERHGLSSLLVGLAAAASFGATVDLMAVMSSGRGAPPGTVIVDALLFAARIGVLIALAATVVRLVSRLLGNDVRATLPFAAVGLATAPLLLAPLALVPAAAGLWLAGLMLLITLVAWSSALVVINVLAVIPSRGTLIAAALAVPILLYGLADRAMTAGVFALTMQPALVPELPAIPGQGETYELSAGLEVTLPAEWQRVATSVDIAQFGRDIDVLRVTRLRPRELDTFLTGADAALARETRGVEVHGSQRRLWRVGEELVVEDVRSGTYEGRPITHVLYSRRTAVGPVGLLFHYIGDAPLDELLARYRPIALTLKPIG